MHPGMPNAPLSATRAGGKPASPEADTAVTTGQLRTVPQGHRAAGRSGKGGSRSEFDLAGRLSDGRVGGGRRRLDGMAYT